MKPLNILVIGKNGQLGSAFTKLTNQTPHQITVLGRPEADLTDRIKIIKLLSRIEANIVVNAAAYTAVDDAEASEDLAFELNAIGPHHLANACKEKGIPLIHVSTDYVFDGTNAALYSPEDDVAPINAYGRSKLAGEWGCSATYSEGVYIIRTSWVFSEWGSNFVKTMLKIAEGRDTLDVVDDQVGSPTYVYDLAVAILNISEQICTKGIRAPGVYHYANTGTCSWYEFAEKILASKEVSVNKTTSDNFPRPAKRPQFSKLENSKIQQTFNLQIRSWQEALDECKHNLNITQK
jgi:dTDP-4-dehydrorhamnose reductase